jgi:phosphomannomutase/phosphoglucomutase
MVRVATNAGDETIPASIFRAYDIRGIVGTQLNNNSVKKIGQSIGSEALEQGINTLLVGYDGRLSSPDLSVSLIGGIRDSGCNVVSLGLVPTPLLYFATHTSKYSSGVMLTASHNPANYNGLKIVFNQTSLADNQIQTIRSRIEKNQLLSGQGGYEELEINANYIESVKSKIKLKRPLKVVVDCGNAVPGKIAPALFSALECDVEAIFCDLDGNFPNHHPDPTVPENLDLLAEAVLKKNADIGIALDGDGDRVGFISNQGAFINADQILMLLITSIMPNYPGRAVIFDVKCSNQLRDLISQYGGNPIMHKSGHSFMKQKMHETNAILGGEYAAHIFIQDDWFGFDDGLYVAARILQLLSESNESSHQLFTQFVTGISTAEIKLSISETQKFKTMERILELAAFPKANVITLDGLRVEYNDGWGLVRASNTSPALLLRFEADTEARLVEIQNEFKALIHNADKSIEINF